MPSVADTVHRLGGVATMGELSHVMSRSSVRSALRRGEVAKDRRGRYVAGGTAEHLRTAHAMTATLSHESAALQHGWKVSVAPLLPVVTVRRKRHLTAADRARCTPHFRDLPGEVLRRGDTTPLQTVLDCARDLPFANGLAVADSALGAGDLSLDQLRAATSQVRGPGAARSRRVAEHASYVAANPMESVLRAIVLDIPAST